MPRSPITLFTLALIGMAPLGWSLGRERTAPVADEVVIKAADFAFEVPATVRPGRRVIRLVNGGSDLHHVFLLKLAAGKTMGDLLGALKPNTPFPAWAKQIGGPNTPLPGGESVAIVDLAPGTYVVMCVIPAADGMPHIMKGMVKTLEVTGAPVEAATPKPTATAALNNYGFDFAAPLAVGRQVIEFRNDAAQPHEAFLARLAPGKRAADLLTWLGKRDGPPPAIPVGGITGIEPGARQSIIVDLEPGTYAWYCFLPDVGDGREHVAHGMIREFTVPAKGLAGPPKGS